MLAPSRASDPGVLDSGEGTHRPDEAPMLIALPWILAAFQQAKPASAPQAPRLVVMVIVDQLIPEQLQRLGPYLDGGFGRFLKQGAVFWTATVDYANTETGPGHATVATGRYPKSHGIVGNQFVDRELGQLVYCVGDANAHPVTADGSDATTGSVSPANLRGDALGDLLKAANAASKAVTIAGKDRAAVLLGGRKPDAAVWWDMRAGGFTTSTYYGDKLPDFVSVWNKAWSERAVGWEWTSELPGDPASFGTAPDDRPGESGRFGRTLPRRLPEQIDQLAGAVFSSPLIDYFTLELAALAVDTLHLGQDDVVDFLGLSLSGCDAVGHAHGPDSVEVTDLLLRDDRELGRLFARLDELVGAGRWVACLSADHGVLDLPEALRARGIGARRVPGSEMKALSTSVKEAVDALDTTGADLKFAFVEQGFYFDEAAATAAGLDPKSLREAIAAAAEETPDIAGAYTADELARPVDDPWMLLYERCMAPGRSPDVALRPEPWLLFEMAEGTSHGSPYPYDRRVPLAFLGPKVRAQGRFDAASPTDAVPTLLQLIGQAPPAAGLDGRVLDVD